MRASRFNKLVDLENGNKLLFNANSGAIAELPPDTYQTVAKLLSSPESAQSAEEKRHLDHLLYGGFLVEKNPDELTRLKIENDRYRFGRSVFSLNIAPTFECNLACSHCDGRKGRGKMAGQTVKGILNFARSYVKSCDEVQITWFGGEPLLCLDTIEEVQRAISELAAKYDTSFPGSTIITNGYLLDARSAQRLSAAGVSSAQVTLCGTSGAHDSKRSLPDGKGTFDTIIDNIDGASDILDIMLRIEIEPGRADDTRELVRYLNQQGVLSKVGFYFGEPVDQCQVCSDAAGRCRLSERSARAQIELYRELADNVTSRIDYPYLLPVKRCGAEADASYLVAPAGYLFKCWKDISVNVEKSVGSLFSDEWEPFQIENHWRYASFDPLTRPDCTRCEILPLCMGGCAADNEIEDTHNNYECSPLRECLGELLKLRYLYEVREEVI